MNMFELLLVKVSVSKSIIRVSFLILQVVNSRPTSTQNPCRHCLSEKYKHNRNMDYVYFLIMCQFLHFLINSMFWLPCCTFQVLSDILFEAMGGYKGRYKKRLADGVNN